MALSLNPVEAYPRAIRDAVYILSARTDGILPIAKPVGSLIYRMQKYAADVDIMESFKAGSSIEELVHDFYMHFKSVVKRVLSTKNMYYSEVKCGLDTRFTLDLGNCEDGKWYPDKDLIGACMKLHSEKLLSDDEMLLISRAVKLCGSGDDYDVVHEILRRRAVVRWTSAEVLSGKKILAGGVIFMFTDGLKMNSLVKIDTINVLNGHMVEITNAYWLSYHPDMLGDVPVQILDYSPKTDIEKYYYSNLYYNPFKMVKRLFSFARFKYLYTEKPEWNDIVERIFGVVSGDISLLYQIKSEVDTIILFRKLYGNLISGIVMACIDNMKLNISRVLFLSDNVVNKIIMMVDGIMHDRIGLDSLSSYLGKCVQTQTIVELNMVRLNPPPSICLPFPLTYARTIRVANEEIISPFVMVRGNYTRSHEVGTMDKFRNLMADRVVRGYENL